MTTTTRERLKEIIKKDGWLYMSEHEFDNMLSFIETIEKEAEERGEKNVNTVLGEARYEKGRQEGREEMRKEVRDLMNEWDDYVIFEEHFNQL